MDVKAIFLYGSGSVGKTSIAKALQAILDEPYLHVGFDLFVPMMPEPYILKGKKSEEGLCFKNDKHHTPVFHAGSTGKRFIKGIHNAIAALAAQGNNIILDEVLTDDISEEYKKLLSFCKIITVCVLASYEVIEKREKERGDRLPGQARKDYHSIYKNKVYDVTVDAGELSPQECAKVIDEYIRKKVNN